MKVMKLHVFCNFQSSPCLHYHSDINWVRICKNMLLKALLLGVSYHLKNISFSFSLLLTLNLWLTHRWLWVSQPGHPHWQLANWVLAYWQELVEDKSTCFSVEEVSAIHLTCKDVKDRDDVNDFFQTGTCSQDSNTDFILCIIWAIACNIFVLKSHSNTTFTKFHQL